MKKIVTIVGARPQFIKAAAVSRALAGEGGLSEVIIHTGQHYDANMSDIFFDQMAIPMPNYNLGIGGGLHGAMTGRQLEKIEEVLLTEVPDCVLVYGDTNSTLAGALAASKLHVPVAHIEAGLRSFNRYMPEEINRVVVDHISTLLFAPAETARMNLKYEGITGDKVSVVGDVMYDAALFYKDRAIKPEWFDALSVDMDAYVLCTIHRAENTDDPARLKSLFQGLVGAGKPVVLPLHPRTRAIVESLELNLPASIHIVEPVGYLEMVWLEMHCQLIATDSGGVQKEAYFHNKPCVTMRDETEWVELVEAGCNRLVGANADLLASALRDQLSGAPQTGLYGNGDSSTQIVSLMREYLS